ncbi:MAG: hypothetical protein V3U74_07765, partial [Thermodesulfobacteriota bacterium]
MRTKWLYGFIAAAFVLIYVSTTATSIAQHIRPVGKTEEEASQLVFWYDNAPTGQEGFDEEFDRRFAFLQVTNASVDTPVTVHIQIFASGCTNFPGNLEPCAPADTFICQETNFF